MRMIVRLIVLVVILVPLALLAVPAALVLWGLDKAPNYTKTGELAFDEVTRARALLQRADPREMPPDRVSTVTATDREINAAIATGLAAVWRVAGGVAASRAGVQMGATVELPSQLERFGRYLNVHAIVAPSTAGLEIAQFSIGRIEVPPGLVRTVVGLALDRFVGAGKGDEMLASVRSVAVAGNRITVGFRPPPTLVEDVKVAARRALDIASAETVRAYYAEIARIAKASPGPQPVSFAAFVGPLFQLAAERSRGGDPVAENGALLLALATYFGDDRFERVVGPVRTGALAGPLPDSRHVRLEGRHDWVQHFTISAALTVAGGTGAANVIGEVKEIKDADGPSGFSLTDIGADRAGVRLAQRATAGADSARQVQKALAGRPKEADFFPKVGDLPEGMSEAVFKRRYGDLNSPAYAAAIQEIDRRIGAVPLYR